MVLGNYMLGGRRREEGALHDVGMFGAVFAAAGWSVDASRSGHILVIWVCRHVASVRGPAGHGADGVETSPQQDASDDQEQDAAGQPDAHGELPARSVVTIAVIAQSAEHLALLPHRIGRLTRHTQEVGGLWEEVGQERGGLTDGDAFLVHETLALVAHQQAVPVWVVHDAVEGVQAFGGRWPAHFGWGSGDVVDHNHHDARLFVSSVGVCGLIWMKDFLSYRSVAVKKKTGKETKQNIDITVM